MKIKVIAPSACVDQDQILFAQQQMQELDVDIELSNNIFATHRYLAGSVATRIDDLKDACLDPSVDAIWCGRGGTGSAQLLPHLDTWLLDKPLIGYSDSTVLLNYIAMHGGQAVHAPVFQEVASKNLNEFMPISKDAQEVLALLHPMLGEMPQQYIVNPYNTIAEQATEIKGVVLGGNLATLCSVQGTPWALQLKQDSIHTIKLKAIVMGDFYQCPQKNVPHDLMDIFAEHCDSLGIPLFQADWFGHGESNRPFCIGGHATLKGQQLLISKNNK